MRKLVLNGVLAAALVGMPLAVGCDRTIAERETTRHERDGDVSRTSEKVVEKPDGSIVVEKEKNVRN